MPDMGEVIVLAQRRASAGSGLGSLAGDGPDHVALESGAPLTASEPGSGAVGPDRFDDRRAMGELEAAFARLESALTDEDGGTVRVSLDRPTETELLAVIGELALGYVPEAARRLERLGARIDRVRTVRRTAGG
jgi:hypothetical protein